MITILLVLFVINISYIFGVSETGSFNALMRQRMQDSICDLLLSMAVTVKTFAHRDIAANWRG